jgi:transglutaminase-like putative cysteine protease
MEFILESENIKDYLISNEIIDCDADNIIKLAEFLSEDPEDEVSLVKKVYEYVRDDIHHSFDINGIRVTCKASDVLQYKEGICFSKSHLLAALLRYLRIPAGFCYQKILKDEQNQQFILHGLNAVFLESMGKWIRLDARGNKNGLNAQFSVEEEILCYKINPDKGEVDDKKVYVNPLPTVIEALTKSKTVDLLKLMLPKDF